MKLILRYLRPYWIFAAAAPFLMLIEVFMDLMLPTIMARIIDEGIASQNLSLVLRLGSYMILVTIIAFIGGSSCSVMASFASTGLGADLRRDLFRKSMEFSYKNIDSITTGNLITRLTNDITRMEDVTRMMLRIMIRAPLQIVGSLVMAIIISPSLSLSFALLVPLMLVTLVLIFRKAYPLFYTVQSKLDTLNTRIQENLAGKRLVKAFVREKREEEKFAKANADLTDTTITASRTIAAMHPAMHLLMNTGIIIGLWYGARLIDLKMLKVGSLIAFLNYLRQLLFSLMMFSNLLMRFSRAQASSARIREVLESTPDIQSPPEPVIPPQEPEGGIRFSDVTFAYSQEGDSVLRDISFGISPGSTFAVIGATGSGKTSLVHLIPRFYDASSGTISLDGTDIRRLPLSELRKRISIAPQQTTLFSGTIRQNILFSYPRELHRDPELEGLMEECAASANISTFIHSLPEGYDTDVNQRGVNLSGGQKQRIAIARALAKRAAVLILDDATSAVDMATEKRIQNAMDSYPMTKIIIAQRISSVIHADTIAVLDDGTITGLGTHNELIESNSLYREIYNSQIDTGMEA